MKVKKLFRAVNWEQIILYFVAFWLFSHSFQVFACLFDLQTAEAVRLAEDPRLGTDAHYHANTASLNTYMAIGRVLGLVAGFVFTIQLARVRGGNWINPAIAFIVALVLGIFNLMGWSLVKNVFLSPGSLFNGATYYIVDGLILLLLAVGIIYYNHKIRKKKNEPDEDIEFA